MGMDFISLSFSDGGTAISPNPGDQRPAALPVAVVLTPELLSEELFLALELDHKGRGDQTEAQKTAAKPAGHERAQGPGDEPRVDGMPHEAVRSRAHDPVVDLHRDRPAPLGAQMQPRPHG